MIDLHCHTRKSDSSMEIYDIIKIAKANGITHLAITDHDTTIGIDEATEIGKNFNIKIILGIEITAFDYENNKIVHILGYYIDHKSVILNSVCAPVVKARNNISKKIVKRMIALGYDIDWSLVKNYAEGSSCVNKKHIMHAILDKGYCSNIYNEIYEEMIRINYTNSIKYLDVCEAIKAITLSGGVPVLAHPGVFKNYPSIGEWVKNGLSGIEVEHPSHSKEDKELCKFFSNRYALIETGGSDFHGIYGSSKNNLGCKGIGLEAIEQLKERSNINSINNFKVV